MLEKSDKHKSEVTDKVDFNKINENIHKSHETINKCNKPNQIKDIQNNIVIDTKNIVQVEEKIEIYKNQLLRKNEIKKGTEEIEDNSSGTYFFVK